MPKIPVFERRYMYPEQTGKATMPISSAGYAARAVAGTFTQIGEIASNIAEKEAAATEALEAAKLTNSMREEGENISEGFLERTDYHNFMNDANLKIEEMKRRLEPTRASRGLRAAFERAMAQEEFRIKRAVRAKQYQVMEETGKIAIGEIEKAALEDYAKATDENERKSIIGSFNIQAGELVAKHVISPLWGHERMDKFEERANKYAAELDDVKFLKGVEENPGKMYTDMADPAYLPNLKGVHRENRALQAKRIWEVKQREDESKIKAQEKLYHDNKELEISHLFSNREYAKALAMVQDKKNLLTADEVAVWTNRIDSKSKVDEDEIDPIIEGSNYAFINELISKEVNPKTIRKYIMSYELKTGTRNKLLDRLDTETDKTVNKLKSRAYDYMKGQIMPYGGMQAAVPPLQSASYNKAMNALDDWVDQQRKAEKPITPKDIRAKSEELAITYGTLISERQEYIQKENNEYFENLKKPKEKKVEPPKAVTPPVQKREYKSISEVQGDYKAGKLTYDEAAQILRSKFGVK